MDGEGDSCIEQKCTGTNILRLRPRDPAKHPVAIRNAGHAKFRFSSVFEAEATQDDVFEKTALPLIDGLFQGHSGVVFAYGVTCSGKTWTIQGDNKNPGILPRSLDVIVNSISVAKGRGLLQETVVSQSVEALTSSKGGRRKRGAKVPEKVHDANYLSVDGSTEYSIFASYLEVYNEQCYDLFDTPYNTSEPSVKSEPVLQENVCENSNDTVILENDPSFLNDGAAVEKKRSSFKRRVLKLKEDRSGEVYAEGQIEIEISSGADIDRLLEFGQQNRTVAHTKANAHSSRSHAVFIITLKQCETLTQLGGPPKMRRTSAKLHIVDLAGSERTSRTNNTGSRLKEAAQINTSLMNLGRCLSTMRQNQRIKKQDPSMALRVVPFRQSRLTRLLQHSLSSGAAVMIANVSPTLTDADETIHALRCAAIAREVTTSRIKKKAIIVDSAEVDEEKSETKFGSMPKGGEVKTRGQVINRRTRSQTTNTVTSCKSPDALKKIVELEAKLKASEAKLKASEAQVESLRVEAAHVKNDFEEEIMEMEALGREGDKERDMLFRENERLRDRLIETEARFVYIEAEIREDVAQEAQKIIKEVQERFEQQLEDKDRIISQAEIERRANQFGRRVAARASMAAQEAMPDYDENDMMGHIETTDEDYLDYIEEDVDTYVEEDEVISETMAEDCWREASGKAERTIAM